MGKENYGWTLIIRPAPLQVLQVVVKGGIVTYKDQNQIK